MLKLFAVLAVLVSVHSIAAFAEDPRLATFQETITVFVDQTHSDDVTASVSLQTTSIQEFLIPPELDTKIRNSTGVVAVVITNEDQCILGVIDEICVMINTKRMEGDSGITATQDRSRAIGESLIEDINKAFGLNAEFHSVFIHYDDAVQREIGTTGEISGGGTVSAVYTAPMQKTEFMFNTISPIMIPKQIRDMGGFYDIALALSRNENSKMTVSIMPSGKASVMSLQVFERHLDVAKDLREVDPLQYFDVDQIRKSNYFSVGFFPLNSLVQVVILLNEDEEIRVKSTVEPVIKNDQRIPSEITKAGWFFDSVEDKKIEAIYMFGETLSADRQDLLISLGDDTPMPEVEQGEIYILIGIGVVAAGAAAYYLKGVRKKS